MRQDRGGGAGGGRARRGTPATVRPLTFPSAPPLLPSLALSGDGDPGLGEKVPAAHGVAHGWQNRARTQ